MVLRSIKSLVFIIVLSSLICAFPITTGFVFSDADPLPALVRSQISEAGLLPVVLDPAVRSIDHLLSFYNVEPELRSRVSKAIVESGKKYNLDPKLIAAIVIVESRANPFAISEADSVGVMQIHLPTWGTVADRENINLFKVEDNVRLGARILSGYVTRYGLWDGVMRYNGWNDNPESEQHAAEYMEKVKKIYQPQSASATDPQPTTSEAAVQ
jgi:soluble lytic murein transglycosylase-like protein